jgi:hypothetical protein
MLITYSLSSWRPSTVLYTGHLPEVARIRAAIA